MHTFTYETNGTATVRGAVSEFKELGENGETRRPLLSLSKPQDPNVQGKWVITATVKAMYDNAADHGLEVGESVKIVNAGTLTAHSTAYNGNFKITAVPTSSSFQFELATEPENIGSGFMPGYYGRIWRTDWYAVENNIIELNIRTIGPEGFNSPFAVFFYGGGKEPQYLMRQLLVRDNLIRNIDNRSDPNNSNQNLGLAYGIWLTYDVLVENALLQKNLIRLDRDELFGNIGSMPYYGSEVRTFDNNSPQGKLLFAKSLTVFGATAPELVSKIQTGNEEVELLSMLRQT